MPVEMTTEISIRMAAVEARRVEQEKVIGVDAARSQALGELNELLGLEQAALERHPYGRGHASNEWAIQVAIEKLRRETRDLATMKR